MHTLAGNASDQTSLGYSVVTHGYRMSDYARPYILIHAVLAVVHQSQ